MSKYTRGKWQITKCPQPGNSFFVDAGEVPTPESQFSHRIRIGTLDFNDLDKRPYDGFHHEIDFVANSNRVVECVNACDGIADTSVVPEMLEALKSIAESTADPGTLDTVKVMAFAAKHILELRTIAAKVVVKAEGA